ncbi:unnamed protein product [Adineta ricciae]|uniref:AMP-binding enzyme C-terminal domain-containing protein n=1 Tax=Adineta ricciae TaxID=249248 RepID=A0A814A386_ADIRI|nr:unnamed protein product [Adineta ricciae]
MFIGNTKRFLTQQQASCIVIHLKLRHASSSAVPPAKLTSSYFHHSSSLPFVYKTISQNFDETAAKYPDHECYVFSTQVFSIPDERYGEEVCTWIKLKPNAPTCTVNDITKFLSDKLAFFKIPKHIRFVDKFIMTPTGKVQKFKLSEAMVAELKEVKSKK